MRGALVLIVLGGMCLLVWRNRVAMEEVASASTPLGSSADTAWVVTLVAGQESRAPSRGARPSGLEPMTPLPLAALPHEGRGAQASEPPAAPPSPPRAAGEELDAEEASIVLRVVRPNESLGKICEERYGTVRPRIPQRVAQYNGLENPNLVQTGSELRLPDLEFLPRLEAP